MKKIKIFLGSSITEFEKERNELELFIRNVSDRFEDNYNIKIVPLRCENMDNYVRADGTQSAINEELVLGSNMCFFIFFTKAGEFTEEEFRIAFEKFKKDGKPKIYIYFKNIPDGIKVEDSVKEFMSKIDNELKHYHGAFDHIDTIKLRILLNLKLQEMDFVSVEFENGKCVVDGKRMLDLSNVSEFANNGLLKQLKTELVETEEQYFQMKPIYAKGNASDAFCKKYAQTASRRQSLIDSIEELQKNIFNMSLQICKDEVRGEITLRQKEAYRLFELGDYEGALAVLEAEEINNDYFRKRELRKEMQRKESIHFIQEHKTAINILMTMVNYKNRFKEIEERYEIITTIAEEDLVELGIIYNYACYLYAQNKSYKALGVAIRLSEIYSSNPEQTDDYDKFRLYNLIGMICCELSSMQHIINERYYLSIIQFIEKFAEENPERYSYDLAISYNNAGVFYKNQGEKEKAEGYYLKATKIREKLAEENPERYNPDLARSYNNAGNFYTNQGKKEEAENFYLKAIEIFEIISDENSERYSYDLASSYNNAGVFYKSQGDVKRAEAYYFKAIEIFEKLAEGNPDRYNPDLSHSYNNVGTFYNSQGNVGKAEHYCFKAIEIQERLAEENPERFSQDLAVSYCNAGAFYYEQDDVRKAEDYYRKSIEIFEKLAEGNPDRYNPDLAKSYSNASAICEVQGNVRKAEEYYLKAIEIYENLAEKNLERYNPGLASIYLNVANFYDKNSNVGKAADYYIKTLEIMEKLAYENPERHNLDLAVTYYNFAIFTRSKEFFFKAYQLAKVYPDNIYCRRIVETIEKNNLIAPY